MTYEKSAMERAGAMAGGMPVHELRAYMAAAARGDVFPALMRLSSARANAAWTDRATMILSVGPACRDDVLDTACVMMPRATEPLLLRAARAMYRANGASSASERRAFLDLARTDLSSASLLDPMDATVRVLFAELAGPRAWAFAA